MKRILPRFKEGAMYPAAFRRLCVETFCAFGAGLDFDPAAFRRLCVETKQRVNIINIRCQPPSGGCVLKLNWFGVTLPAQFPAAFRRLCVETGREGG